MLSSSVNTSGLCLFAYKNKLSSTVTQTHVTQANVIASVTANATLARASIYVCRRSRSEERVCRLGVITSVITSHCDDGGGQLRNTERMHDAGMAEGSVCVCVCVCARHCSI